MDLNGELKSHSAFPQQGESLETYEAQTLVCHSHNAVKLTIPKVSKIGVRFLFSFMGIRSESDHYRTFLWTPLDIFRRPQRRETRLRYGVNIR